MVSSNSGSLLLVLFLLVDVQQWSDGYIIKIDPSRGVPSSILQQKRKRAFQSPVQQPLYSTTSDKDTDTSSTDEGISEVDARVLEAMLKDDKLDLDSKDNMRKLLERGIKKDIDINDGTVGKEEEDPERTKSEYSSTFFKNLAETKLWQAVQKKAGDIVDSAKLFVANRVERDSGLLLALGIFAWDRAVQDVARALPAASTFAKQSATFLLAASRQEPNATDAFLQSNNDPKTSNEIFDDMATPMDEIKSVTSSIRAILLEEETSASANTGRRSLKTALPAGQANSARLQRAYQRRRKIRQEEASPRAMMSGVVDSAYELQRDLKSETNQPGYKTEKIRNAIEAGAESTTKLLGAVKDNLLLGAAKRKEYVKQLKQANSYKTEIIPDLIQEQCHIVDRLEICIEEPEETWLQPEFVQVIDHKAQIQEDGIRELVRLMITKRDEIEENMNQQTDSFEKVMTQLRTIKSYVEELQQCAKRAVSDASSEALGNNLLGISDNYGQDPIMLRLDEIEEKARVEEIQPVSLLQPPEETIAAAAPTGFAAAPKSDFFASTTAANVQATPPPDTVVTEAEVIIESNDESTSFSANGDDNAFFAGSQTKSQEENNSRPFTTANFFATRDKQSTQKQPEEEKYRTIKPDAVEVIQEATVMDASTTASPPPPRVNNGNIQDATISEVANGYSYGNFDSFETNGEDQSTAAAAVVEIISDDDFEMAMGERETKEVKVMSNEVEESQEDKGSNIILDLLLRSFDILFFILEKAFMVGLPKAVETGKTAKTRLDNVAKSGLGSKGWKTIGNAKEGSNRY